MNRFTLTINAFDNSLFDGEAEHCRISTPDGAMGIEARHEAFTTRLQPDSDIAVRDHAGQRRSFPIRRGLLTFLDNTCVIVVEAKVADGKH